MKEFFANFFDKYGLSFVMVASYFGSGSIFIASQAGVEYGYVLIWAVIGAVLLGFMAQDMSARLGIYGNTLMTFIRRKLGKKIALALALILAVGCLAWGLALPAAVGKSIEVLLDGAIAWQPLSVATGVAAILVGVMNYDHIEKVMTVMMFVLLLLYLVVAGASGPSIEGVLSGFVPSLPSTGATWLGVAILGTTALWPNFFLESILVQQKGWNKPKHVRNMREDLSIGYLVGGLITVAIIIVSAAVLRPAGYTELSTFIEPGVALELVLGRWAMIVFLIGVIAAAFNSIVPIIWTIPYMVLEALDIDHEDGQSNAFKIIFTVCIMIGMTSPLVAEATGLSVIEMITLFPAFNGVIGLPITAILLFWGVNDERFMGEHTNTWGLNLLNALLVIFAVYIAVTSGGDVFNAIFGKLLA